jgi:predicted metal-dependent HD superfamily phosphohydrolase
MVVGKTDMIKDLATNWHQLIVDYCRKDSDHIVPWFGNIYDAYTEPHRQFHTLYHIYYLLHGIYRASTAEKFTSPLIALAGWFHDYVYEPGSPDNELNSADVAEKFMADMGFSEPEIIVVREMILATKDHRPKNQAQRILCDVDMAVLSARPDVYDNYVTALRAEYSAFDDETWTAGRLQFLRELSNRPNVYYLPSNQGYNQVARRNMMREIQFLVGTK